MQAQVRARGGYARRYDPIRSTVEHDALRRRKVNLAGEAANLKVAHADLCAEFETVELQRAYERRVADETLAVEVGYADVDAPQVKKA